MLLLAPGWIIDSNNSNSMYIRINQSLLSRLQHVQNAAAQLLTKTQRHERITPIRQSLHWLPVKLKIDFKILMFIFKALHDLTPPYLSELLTHRNHTKVLQASSHPVLEVPRSCHNLWDDGAFAVAGHGSCKLWNNLQTNMRVVIDLRTCLFRMAFNINVCFYFFYFVIYALKLWFYV